MREFPPGSGIFRPMVTTWVSHKHDEVGRSIVFLIDTGSPYTLISEKDAVLLNLDFDALDKYVGERDIRGISGPLPSRNIKILRDVHLKFSIQKGFWEAPVGDVLVIKNYFGPSLLGADFFELTGFKLEIDYKNREVIIRQP